MKRTVLLAASIAIGLVACSARDGSPVDPLGSGATELALPDDAGAAATCVDRARWRLERDVAIDTTNGDLAWQRRTDGVPRAQSDAAAYCASLVTCGLGGWRLPTASELHSIVLNPIGLGGSHGPTCEPSIDARAFPDTPSDAFWSATTREDGDATVGLYTEFDDGRTHPSPPDTPMFVRCVHDAPK